MHQWFNMCRFEYTAYRTLLFSSKMKAMQKLPIFRKLTTSRYPNFVKCLSATKSYVQESRMSTGSSQEASSILPKDCRVVICGGGIIGPSIAFHLAERGWNDVVLLEQGRLTCGTTWHSVGLCGQLRSSATEMKLTQYSTSLYRSLEAAGYGLGWKECGTVSLARTKDRMVDFKRKQVVASSVGLETILLTPNDIKEKCPVIKYDDLEGGIWIPSDGVITAPDLAITFASIAKSKGVKILEGVQVNKIETDNHQVKRVETSHGTINCEYFVNCSGQWANHVGRLSNPSVQIPLHSCEHYYLVTKPLKGIDRMMPVIRDYDGHIYAREWNGGLMIGGFEPHSKPVFQKGIPDKFEFQLLPEDWDHFQVLMDSILHRYPTMNSAEIRQLVNGPESFTPDSNLLLGESAEIKNYFVAAGMNSRGIISSGGVGKCMAEWIIDGEPSLNLWQYDIRRFTKHHNQSFYLEKRVAEVLGNQYKLPYPRKEYDSGRELRLTPLHNVLKESGARFGEVMGYERPLWFSKHDEGEDAYMHRVTFGKPGWFSLAQEEIRTCKENVGMVDMTAVTKLEIKSESVEVVNYLQGLCSNNIDVKEGDIVLAPMLNKSGGYENVCYISRLAENHFFLTCPIVQETRALSYLRRNIGENGPVKISDLTEKLAGICLIGPNAHVLLSQLLHLDDLSEMMSCKKVQIEGIGDALIMRVTYTGEDGFTIYINNENASQLYDRLIGIGSDYGVKPVGHHAVRQLRMENGLLDWGEDIDPHTTPLECGAHNQVHFEKGDFIGKNSLLKQRKDGVSKRFVQLTLEDFNLDQDLWPWGSESIFENGQFVGRTSSCGFDSQTAKVMCCGYVSTDTGRNGSGLYEINIAGEMYPAKGKERNSQQLQQNNRAQIPRVTSSIV